MPSKSNSVTENFVIHSIKEFLIGQFETICSELDNFINKPIDNNLLEAFDLIEERYKELVRVLLDSKFFFDPDISLILINLHDQIVSIKYQIDLDKE